VVLDLKKMVDGVLGEYLRQRRRVRSWGTRTAAQRNR